MSIRVGIVGVSGYGGGEALRLCASHPAFELAYVAGESSAGQKLSDRFPGVSPKLGDLVISKWDPADLPKLDVLFASLPTGESKEPLARVATATRVVDIGGDHRYVQGWTYGLADVFPDEIKGKTRIANPGCYPAAALTALAPLLAEKLIDPHGIVIDAKTGVSGAGRGGGADSKLGYGEVNEDLAAYGLLKHVHMPEMTRTISKISGTEAQGLVFTPHLVPMTRGILATIYAKGKATTEQCLAAARKLYAGRCSEPVPRGSRMKPLECGFLRAGRRQLPRPDVVIGQRVVLVVDVRDAERRGRESESAEGRRHESSPREELESHSPPLRKQRYSVLLRQRRRTIFFWLSSYVKVRGRLRVAVAVETRDPDAMAGFYEQIFGARIVKREGHPVMAYLGETGFAFHEWGGPGDHGAVRMSSEEQAELMRRLDETGIER